MDFLTTFPYVGIIILIVINAVLVSKQKVVIDDDHADQNTGS